MNISLEEKKAEAVKRMKIMGVFPETISQFEKENLVSVSMPPVGAFFWADKKTSKRIKKFEESFNILIYLVVRSYTEFGQMDSYFFVSDYKDEEWAQDIEDLKQGQAFAYVFNHNEPLFSEFGTIGFKRTIADGIVRTW